MRTKMNIYGTFTLIKIISILIVIVITIESFFLKQFKSQLEKTQSKKKQNYLKDIRLNSSCSCRKDLILKRHNENSVIVNGRIVPLTPQASIESEHDYLQNYRFTCDLHKVLRRGQNQRIISYSLYGTNKKALDSLIDNIKAIRKFTGNWSMRIYHRNEMSNEAICHYECSTGDVVDFCDITRMPYFNPNTLDVQTCNASYVHGMMWRWFPIADEFVDYFGSRDLDSQIIEREKSSVDVWLQQKTLFHVMRDSPYHRVEMLGGLWGYANVLNLKLGKTVFNQLLFVDQQKQFNFGQSNPKYTDQTYLSLYVWNLAKFNATIHDSYLCMDKDLKGQPFPTKRQMNLNCYVACFWPCCELTQFAVNNETQHAEECPLDCRPADHKDWHYC